MRVSYPWAKVIFKAIYEDPANPDGDEVAPHPVYPLEVTVECNSYREADTAKLTCDFKEQPIDPRLIKSLAIMVHMGTLRRAGEKPILGDDNLRFVGFVDVPSMEFSDDGKKVSFEARDYTGLLIDTKIGSDMVDLRRPVHDVIKGLLAQEPCFANIEVELRGIEDTPILAEVKSDWNHKSASEKGDTYWDKIVDLVQQAGLICYIDKDKLVITKAKTVTPASYVELFLYGKNLKKLTIKRDLKKKQKTNIEVRSYDDKQKRTLIGRYPQTPVAKKVVTGEESSNKTEIYPFVVANINDQQKLNEIAESIYWQLVREEVSGTIETEETRTLWADKDNSLMGLKHGDAVFVGFHSDGSGLVDFHSMSQSARQGYLRGMGYPDDLAERFAKLYETDKMYGPYYVKKASHKFDVDDGYSLSVDFINFFDPDKLAAEDSGETQEQSA